MRLLCIDTCFDACSVGIFETRGALCEESRPLKRGHAEILAPMTREILRETRLAIEDMDRIAVTVGPGSFTGIRVGVAFARGLAVGQNIDVVGVTSLQVLAQSAIDATTARDMHPTGTTLIYAALIQARHGGVYGQIFARDQTELCSPFEASPADALRKIDKSIKNSVLRLPQVVLVGTGADLVRTARQDAGEKDAQHRVWPIVHPGDELLVAPQAGLDLTAVARLATQFAQLPAATPLYMRAADAKKIS